MDSRNTDQIDTTSETVVEMDAFLSAAGRSQKYNVVHASPTQINIAGRKDDTNQIELMIATDRRRVFAEIIMPDTAPWKLNRALNVFRMGLNFSVNSDSVEVTICGIPYKFTNSNGILAISTPKSVYFSEG